MSQLNQCKSKYSLLKITQKGLNLSVHLLILPIMQYPGHQVDINMGK